MAILPVGIGPQEGGYQIERSLRFNSADSADLNRTFSTPTDNNRCTISLWVKKTTNSAGPLDFGFLTTGVNISVVGISGTGAYGASLDNKIFIRNNDTNKDYWYPVLRDNSAWYHIVIAINTDESTQADRAKLWINGVSRASNKQASGFSLSEALTFNTASTVHRIGSIGTSYPTYYSNGYLSEYYFIDGQALDPTSFGEYNTDTGVWQPIAYTGSYGTNGFYLNFSDNSGTTSTTLGKDYSGNSNNWTPNNFSVTAGAGNDSLVDTPTSYGTDTGVGGEVRGNYATLNPLASKLASGSFAVSNGNLNVLDNATSYGYIPATMAVSSGKWYWEISVTYQANSTAEIGLKKNTSASMADNNGVAGTSDSYSYVSSGSKRNNTSTTAYGSSWTTNDVIGVALDLDAGTLAFYKNGSSQGTAFSSLSGEYFPAFGDYSNTQSFSYSCNFGQRPFAYSAPSGFKALCTQNLPDPTIADGSTAMNVVTYTGNGGTQTVSGVGFQPDFVWAKGRSVAYSNRLYDVIRGATKSLVSNNTDGEATLTTQLTAFASDGFTLGSDVGLNQSSATYVAWNWKANGTGVTNTAGSITSTVSANPTAGFSIVTYTGTGSAATVGHGLGTTPSMIIVKNRSASPTAWRVYHSSLGLNGSYPNFLQLNLTAAVETGDSGNFTAAPSNTVFSVGNYNVVNGSGNNMVAYCFAPVAGYSAFGSYTGNGSADGPFIYTGFRPRYVLIKCSSVSGSGWAIMDTSRIGYNVSNNDLYADLSNAEATSNYLDIVSNGFKLRSAAGDVNGSTRTYIYAAFGDSFKFALGR